MISNLTENTRIAVIGGGSWATALVKILIDAKRDVSWWMRDEAAVDNIRKYKRNLNYLRSAEINIADDKVSSNLEEIINSNDCLIFAVPIV